MHKYPVKPRILTCEELATHSSVDDRLFPLLGYGAAGGQRRGRGRQAVEKEYRERRK